MGTPRPPTGLWFAEHSGAALFIVGTAIVFVGLLAPGQQAATTVAALFLGGGMMLIGALLPRLVGTIRISPGGIELALAERLEATRREAEQRVPAHVDQAVARAIEELRPVLGATARPVPSPEAAEAAAPASPRGRTRWLWTGVVLSAVAVLGWLYGSQLDADPPAVPGRGFVPPAGGGGGWLYAVLLITALLGLVAWTLRRVVRRSHPGHATGATRPVEGRGSGAGPGAGPAAPLEPARVFARRIVDGLVADIGTADDPGDADSTGEQVRSRRRDADSRPRRS